MNMKVLQGIDVQSFVHPMDESLMKGMEKAQMNWLMGWLSDAGTKYMMDMHLMGRCIRVSEQDMPQLYALLKDVCRVLDYPQIPSMFVYRSKLFEWQIYQDKKPVIVLTDFVLHDFDEGMLRFHLGCAVTALKAKSCRMRIASTFAMPMLKEVPLFRNIVGIPLACWARAATLTEDRGGLLACQDEHAVWRYMLRLCGIPREMINEDMVDNYLAQYKPGNALSSVSKKAHTLKQTSPWQNDRLAALYTWFCSGAYDRIVQRY